MRKAVLILGTGALVWSCSGDDTASPVDQQDAGADGQQDSGAITADGSTDAPELDAGTDAELDAGTDAELDAGPDAELDASADAEVDAGTDAEVDAGTDAGDGGSPCDPSLGQVCDGGPYNFAFITSQKFVPGTLTPEQADAKCEELAHAAGLTGSYVAWRSSSTSDVRDRLGSASGWLRTDGRPFALDATALYAGDIKYPLVVDELGQLTTGDIVPTGTEADGRAASATCNDWTDATEGAHAFGGASFAGDDRWTIGFQLSCDEPARLYCLGIDHATPITLPPPPTNARRAFITKGSLAGNAGRDAADALCASEASSNGLTGTYVALMATSTEPAASRFDGTKPVWFRTDGLPLWTAAADLLAGKTPLLPLNRHADAAVAGLTVFAWTGAVDPSKAADANCDDWQLDSADGGYAFPGYLIDWFRSGVSKCTANRNVYCLEQ